MNVASISFLGFGLAVALLYNLNRALRWRQAVLLAANLAFLVTFSKSPRAWVPYLGFLVISYVCYLLVRSRFPRSLTASLVVVLFLFFWLKKYTFLPGSFFLESPYVTLGLSYVLFRTLHLLIDTGDGVLPERIGPVTFLNYTLNFTAIISGPIQLFPDYARDQLRAERPPLDITIVVQAIERIIFGYFKISILGLLFQSMQTHSLANLSRATAAPLSYRVLIGAELAIAYPLFLYFNFSGYTDMVIGVAKGIRLTLPENFDRPFTSLNFLEFWSRWHISLSSWLKTYVYSPLLKALMKSFTQPLLIPYLGVLSYFVTFFLIGVWHGRTSVFVVFGILQGAGVAVNKLYQIRMARVLGKKGYKHLSTQSWYRILCRGLTFTYFAFSLNWFWSNWQQMDVIVHALQVRALLLSWLLVLVASSLLLWLYQVVRALTLRVHWHHAVVAQSRYTRVIWGTALAVVLILVLNVLAVPTPEIVYKGF